MCGVLSIWRLWEVPYLQMLEIRMAAFYGTRKEVVRMDKLVGRRGRNSRLRQQSGERRGSPKHHGRPEKARQIKHAIIRSYRPGTQASFTLQMGSFLA